MVWWGLTCGVWWWLWWCGVVWSGLVYGGDVVFGCVVMWCGMVWCGIAAIVANSRTCFYFVDCFFAILRNIIIARYVTACNFACDLCQDMLRN